MENGFESEDVCSECGSKNIIRDADSGESVCGGCGLVLREYIINKGPEWRAFTQMEWRTKSRMGSPINLSVYDKGLSTMIGKVSRDASGRKISPEKMVKMLRLRKWQRRSRVNSSVDRNLARAMSELDMVSDKLNIPLSMKEKAAVIYRKALEKGLVRGRSISAVMAASLYAACRITRTPRKLEEVALQSHVDDKDLGRCYRLLLWNLNLQMPVPSPQTRLPKIAAKVKIGEKSLRTAAEILRRAKRLKTTAGKDPTGLAAAALYIACLINDERRTQKRIADSAGITEVTLRNRYHDLKKALQLDL